MPFVDLVTSNGNKAALINRTREHNDSFFVWGANTALYNFSCLKGWQCSKIL